MQQPTESSGSTAERRYGVLTPEIEERRRLARLAQVENQQAGRIVSEEDLERAGRRLNECARRHRIRLRGSGNRRQSRGRAVRHSGSRRTASTSGSRGDPPGESEGDGEPSPPAFAEVDLAGHVRRYRTRWPGRRRGGWFRFLLGRRALPGASALGGAW
jgi:hypothetical protein